MDDAGEEARREARVVDALGERVRAGGSGAADGAFRRSPSLPAEEAG
jgi:hypothetical protein